MTDQKTEVLRKRRKWEGDSGEREIKLLRNLKLPMNMPMPLKGSKMRLKTKSTSLLLEVGGPKYLQNKVINFFILYK